MLWKRKRRRALNTSLIAGGGFGHNVGVNEPEMSIGSGSESQVGYLLVCGLRRGRRAHINLGEQQPHDFCVNPCRG